MHTDAAGPCLGYRIELGSKILAFSGDTEWTETLINVGGGADLFICECYTRQKEVPAHTNLTTLEQHLPRIAPKRLILTHMSDDMLAHLDEVAHTTASDGLAVNI